MFTNVHFAVAAEQVAYPVTMQNAQGQTVIAETEAEFLTYQKVGYSPVMPVNSGTARSRAAAPNLRKNISKAEAKKLQDRNLAESLGVPSALSAKGVGFKFTGKVVQFLEKFSQRTANTYPVAQISYVLDGATYTNCVLFDDRFELGTEAAFVLEASDATRSGVTVVAL